MDDEAEFEPETVERMEASEEPPPRPPKVPSPPPLSTPRVNPGCFIAQEAGYIRGHGTIALDERLYATVPGTVEQINRLITVRPFRSPRYLPEVGDVVVGRITEVVQKRWKVDIYARQDAYLQLSAVNLPGGELRRRSAEDELMMREYLKESDIISAEVQKVTEDGMIALHTRSLKYGKLGQGIVITLKPSCIRRSKTHFHTLPCGVSMILGNNGYIWVGATVATVEGQQSGGFLQSSEAISRVEREAIARVHNVIRILADISIAIYDTSVIIAYDLSLAYTVNTLVTPSVRKELAEMIRVKIALET